ncbi:MAG: TIGR04282 family arsenosugar biosynthesis glycosyltransferase [Chloroflexi bacterium]|nr:TIGR04282 family arsenosugar biosynthesis glycosyltransferase [Chloroflexota bacterium]OJV92755.1 MAG: hypothetical protein BGO39_29770 [Chloroflexi bacterium 54-19]
MTASKEALIVVVAKAPQVGNVKTRLCPPLTHEQAARLYTGFLLDTIEIALGVPGCAVKAVCPTPHDAGQLAGLLPTEVGYFVQPATGLTAALSSSFEQGLTEGYKKIFCISSDNPTLPAHYLQEAVETLDRPGIDLVMGPSEDGGYYLIGAKKLYPELFADMVWSTDTVLSETLVRAEKRGLRHHRLPLWYDLDTGQELARFALELAAAPAVSNGHRAPAPHTRPLLIELEILKDAR